jgi:flagella basal body P-ring formation protein FlgA
MPDPDAPLTDLLTVDALEGDVARVELPDGTTVDLSRASLPKGIKEGDALRLTVEGGDMEIDVDAGASAQRQQQAQGELDILNQPINGEVNL